MTSQAHPTSQSTLPAPSHLSTSQVDDLIDQAFSTPSLSGRSVLVPFSKQAFLVGELQPTRNEQGEEQVQIRVPKEATTDFTVAEAKAWLQQYSSKPNNTQKVESNVSPQPKSSITSQPKVTSTSSNPMGNVGFVDIHEEYNADGSQKAGEVVDVSRQLQAIWNNADEQSLPKPSLSEEEVTVTEPTPLKSLTDDEYDDLAHRLDELARLEEEEQQRGSVSKVPTMRKNKGGWKRGFLTSKATAKKQPVSSTRTAKQQTCTPVSKTRTATTPPAKLETPAPPVAASASTVPSKGVSFETQDQIREIPRIGTQKLPPKKPHAQQGPIRTKPLEDSLFSGVIQERPLERNPSTSAPQNPPKRKSRFAQERQGFR